MLNFVGSKDLPYTLTLIPQILQARNNEELKDLTNTDECGELLERSGCTAILNVSFLLSYYYVVVNRAFIIFCELYMWQ